MDLLLGILGTLLLLSALSGLTISLGKSISGLVTAGSSVSASDVTGIVAGPTVPAAQPGVLTTHTTNTTGSLTMTNANHGIITGQRIDIYWTGGQCYGAVAGTVSGLVVPIASVSGGSNLPASSTAVIIGISTVAAFPCTGNNIQGLVASSSKLSYFVFNSGSDIVALLVQAGDLYEWYVGATYANPLASSTPTVVYMSHNDITQAHTDLQTACVTH